MKERTKYEIVRELQKEIGKCKDKMQYNYELIEKLLLSMDEEEE